LSEQHQKYGPKSAPEPADVGSRASIRVHDDEPGKYRDLLGYLVSPTSIRDKHGVIKSFDPTRIVAWKLLENQ
jgi:hypothetical protein